MDLKTFRGQSAKEILKSIRAELGESAMIHSSKPVPPRRGRRVREIEITASSQYTPDYIPEVVAYDLFASAQESETTVSDPETQLFRAAEELLRLKGVSAKLRKTLVAEYRQLAVVETGFDLALLGRVIEHHLRFGGAGKLRGVQMLLGRPGAGKTTCLQKLALRAAATAKRPIGIITLDNYRLGSAREMAGFAGMSRMKFREVASAEELMDTILGFSDCELILIDTPGIGRNDTARMAEIERVLEVDSRIGKTLVLSASGNSADMQETVAIFSALGAERVILSKCDETTYAGPCLNALCDSGLELSFMSTGQNIPEDLIVATASDFAGLIAAKKIQA